MSSLAFLPPVNNVIRSFLCLVALFVCTAPLLVSAQGGDNLDRCTSTVSLNATSVYCPTGHLLTDERGYGGNHAQCRVLCRSAADASGATTVPSECKTETCSKHKLPDVCVPHAICAAECGIPSPNCVYSGSCASLHCFTSTPIRVSYAGPGTLIKEAPFFPPGIPAFLHGQEDFCGMPLTALNPKIDFAETPVIDGRRPGRQSQCRVLHAGFTSHDIEVLSIPTACELCKSTDADKYWSDAPKRTDVDESLNLTFSDDPNFIPRHVCIPHDVCESTCGAVSDGCVYSGSCENVFCFSGADSKQAGTVVDPTLSAIQITVDNSAGGPDGIRDPPALYFYTKNMTSAVPEASPSGTPSAVPSVVEDVPDVEEKPDDDVPAPSISVSGTGTSTGSQGGDSEVCIGVHHLLPTRHKLVFPEHRRASVLCDEHNNCATPWHIVRHLDQTLTMYAYCQSENVLCSSKVMHVNSPAYEIGLRIPAQSSVSRRGTNSEQPSLHFTAFAARYGTKMEVLVIRVLISLGF